jgi:hypothetical protein
VLTFNAAMFGFSDTSELMPDNLLAVERPHECGHFIHMPALASFRVAD